MAPDVTPKALGGGENERKAEQPRREASDRAHGHDEDSGQHHQPHGGYGSYHYAQA